MPIDERWQKLGPTDWENFARAWLKEQRGSAEAESPAGQAVVMMNFTAAPEHQWQFILASVALAESDDELGHIAAGPIEHLLGWHGGKYIEQVERQAASDHKFARALTGVWKYMMADEVWARVQALQARVSEPLKPTADQPPKS